MIGMAVLDAATSEIRIGHWTDDSCGSKLETVVRQLRVKELLHVKVLQLCLFIHSTQLAYFREICRLSQPAS